jgi:hypothetical protein
MEQGPSDISNARILVFVIFGIIIVLKPKNNSLTEHIMCTEEVRHAYNILEKIKRIYLGDLCVRGEIIIKKILTEEYVRIRS